VSLTGAGSGDGIAAPDGGVLFSSLFAQTAVGIAVGSLEGRFLRVNEAFCLMLGYDERELLQKSVQDLTHVDDLQSREDFPQQLLAALSRPRVYEKRCLRKDGSTVWVRIEGTLVRSSEDRPQYFVVLVHDITELKAADEALKAGESRFRRMVELSSDWYWVQDENFRFVELPGVEKRGVIQETLIGKARWELPGLAPVPERVWRQHREKLQRHEPFSDFVYVAVNGAGEPRYLSVTGEPISTCRGSSRDITASARTSRTGPARRKPWKAAKSATGCCSISILSRCGSWKTRPCVFSR